MSRMSPFQRRANEIFARAMQTPAGREAAAQAVKETNSKLAEGARK
jgi:hypothetical protein